jgi:hypothetical protein
LLGTRTEAFRVFAHRRCQIAKLSWPTSYFSTGGF